MNTIFPCCTHSVAEAEKLKKQLKQICPEKKGKKDKKSYNSGAGDFKLVVRRYPDGHNFYLFEYHHTVAASSAVREDFPLWFRNCPNVFDCPASPVTIHYAKGRSHGIR